MPLVSFDTCIFIKYKPTTFPSGFRLSAVVLQELVAGAADGSQLKTWAAVKLAREKDGTLLVPTCDDWLEAGRILNSLQRGAKSRKTGKVPPLGPELTGRIVRDVLIARTAKRVGATLVTDNTKDFELIKKYCDVKTVSGEEYFS